MDGHAGCVLESKWGTKNFLTNDKKIFNGKIVKSNVSRDLY